MTEKHGVTVTEKQFTPAATAQDDVTLPVVIGTAPVNLSKLAAAPINTPVLCKSWTEAVEAFGYSEDWESYTLCEFMYSHFQLYKQSPVVLINVLDPAKHKKTVQPAVTNLVKGTVTINNEGVIISSVTVTSEDGTTTYIENTDYILSYDSAGKLVVSAKTGGALASVSTVKVGFDELDASAVQASDIVGGTDSITGKVTGLELIKLVFPLYQLVPGLVLAPGYSHDPIVGAVMAAKANLINGNFKATAITDLPANKKYSELEDWKAENNYTSEMQINTWPKVTKSGRVYHLSTHLAGAICRTDADSTGIPYRSPSNKSLVIDGTCMEDGTVVALGPDEAEYVNSLGIVTSLNFIGGWKSWGNRTAIYPAATDPQRAFIPVRRMFNWWNNTIILTQWAKVDDPTNKRLVEAVTDDLGIRLNGLQSSQYILGGWIAFEKEDNPAESTMNGKLKWRTAITPPSPGQELEFTVEYDPSQLGAIN